MGKRYAIVFEEQGQGFKVYLDGLSERQTQEINLMDQDERMRKLPAVQLWLMRIFEGTVAAMARAQALASVAVPPKDG